MEDALREQLIEQLKPIVNEPEFDKIFAMLTADMSGPERFKLKADLRNLASPCNRQVDLRKRVIGEVQVYTYRGQVHYMDSIAIRIFEDGLERYKGVFTEDTYRRIHQAENNIRVVQAKEKSLALEAKRKGISLTHGQTHSEQIHRNIAELKQEQSIEVPYFTFGRYIGRSEERMNYAAPLMVTIGNKTFPAVTSDISVSGTRIRLKVDPEQLENINLERSLTILVQFTGFKQEFTLDIDDGVMYCIMATEDRPQGTYLRLKRSSEQYNETFDAFLSKFIDGYKHRYKVNVDNIFRGLVSKAHEQLYLPRMGGVPLFFKRIEQRMFPNLALETQMNSHILDGWLDETNQCVVGGLFSGKRLAGLLRQIKENPKAIASTIIYCFQVLRNNKTYFYSALDSELTDPEVKRVFLAYASTRAHFRVYRFSFTRLDIGKAWIPSTVPQDVVNAEEMDLRPPSPEVMKELEGLTHVGLLSDITPAPTFYQQHQYQRDELPQLNRFVHPRRGLSPLVRASFEYVSNRQESRFNYRTQMRIEMNGAVQLGITRDFSTAGLQVEVERQMDIQVGDVVHISLPQLAKTFSDYDLRKMPYRVMNISGDHTAFHLQIVKQDEHPGERFFSYLISSHQRALKPHEQTGTVRGLELCLRNMYCNALMTLPMFLKKPRGKKLALHRVGVSPLDEPMKQSCQELSQLGLLNLQPIVSENFIRDNLEQAWSELEPNSKPWRATIMVRRSIEKGALRTRRMWLLDAEPNSAHAKEAKRFLVRGLAEGEVYALQFVLVRTGRPDTEFIANEFLYLQKYAGHRAEEVEEEMWSIAGIVDVTPVTREVLMRFNLENTG